MRELASLREGWDEIEVIETGLLRAMSVQESLAHWLNLQQTFEYQLQQTAEIFAPERRLALAALQERLYRLADWQRAHGESISLHSDATTASQ